MLVHRIGAQAQSIHVDSQCAHKGQPHCRRGVVSNVMRGYEDVADYAYSFASLLHQLKFRNFK